MEWLEGEDLSARLSRGALPLGDALTVVRRAAEGIGAAHARGIIHRDVKPSNLFLVGGDPSRLKVLDFGIARLGMATQTLTRTGGLLGTIGYMAPEQALDPKRADARADVFSLGCVLYECLTGQPPYVGATPVAVLSKLLCDEPPVPSLSRPGLPCRKISSSSR
jgi:eukaryotic-like serine/threonine-protein kinase